MEKKHYRDFHWHKKTHDAFLNKLRGIRVPLSDDDIEYAKEWWVKQKILKINKW